MMRKLLLFLIPMYRYLLFQFCKICKIFIKPGKIVSKKKQVIITSSLGLGDAMDFICITDKYRQIYNKNEYEITILCTKVSEQLIKKETDFDNYIVINMNSEFCNSLNFLKKIKIIKLLRQKKYDILIDTMYPFVILPSSIFASYIIDSQKKIIVYNEAVLQIPKFYLNKIYNDKKEVNDIRISNIEMYNLMPLYLSDSVNKNIEYKKIQDMVLNLKLPKEYYIVFPSSSSAKKNWELYKYIEIIKRIYTKTKLKVIFCGTNEDKGIIDQIINKLDNKMYINILGKTNILEFIQVIKNSRFIISNDTGAYHIALIQEIPVAIITGGYTYDGFVTYNFKDNNYPKPYIITDKRECFNCQLKCKYNDSIKFPCLSNISIEYAWNIINKMIDDISITNERK